MKKIALIGLGRIAEHYHLGITTSPNYKLVAVCDNNYDCASRELYGNYNFYQDYLQMLAQEEIDCVCVATNPASHKQIAMDCLKVGKNILLEKPATLNYTDYCQILDFAQAQNRFVDTIFHWEYGSEVFFLKDKLSSFGKIQKITTTIRDPYMAKTPFIDENRISLGGAWLDSGINALSMLYRLLNPVKTEFLGGNFKYDERANLPYYASNNFVLEDEISLNITVDWTKHVNEKQTVMILDSGILAIYHTQQRIDFNDKTIYFDNSIIRLVQHYKNFFTYYDEKKIDMQRSKALHRLLFETNGG